MDAIRGNLDHYDLNARELSDFYEDDTARVLPYFARAVQKFSQAEKYALDIGCGSGRDAAWLAERGWSVVASDGSAGMLDEARSRHPQANVQWSHDIAPGLPGLTGQRGRFHVVLMAAFIFHLDKKSRRSLYEVVAPLLAPDALVYFAVRHGPPLEGRTVYEVDFDELRAWGAENNMEAISHGFKKDQRDPDTVKWEHVTLWRGAGWQKAAAL